MCNYCATDAFGDSAGKPLIEKKAPLFETDFEIDQRIIGDEMELYIGVGGTQIIAVKTNISFCPFCGRRLESEESGNEP